MKAKIFLFISYESVMGGIMFKKWNASLRKTDTFFCEYLCQKYLIVEINYLERKELHLARNCCYILRIPESLNWIQFIGTHMQRYLSPIWHDYFQALWHKYVTDRVKCGLDLMHCNGFHMLNSNLFYSLSSFCHCECIYRPPMTLWRIASDACLWSNF